MVNLEGGILKIWVFDNCSFKFSRGLIDHWISKGHEVRYELGANPAASGYADLIYIDWLDGNFYYFYNGPNGDRSQPSYPKKRIVVRAIDLDIWQGRHRDPVIWKYLDDLIVINKYYFDMVQRESQAPPGRLHLIYPGVDLNKFTLSPKPRGKKIAVVTGNMWEAKSTYEAIRLFQEVWHRDPHDWELHIRGQYISPGWHPISYEHLIEVSGLKDRIFIHGQQDNMNEFYKDKDYILVTSHKEAFSYAAAEGMACGLKPIINHFFGSEWPDKYRFTSFHQALNMIFSDEYAPDEYRAYIADHYNLNTMLAEYDKLFGT